MTSLLIAVFGGLALLFAGLVLVVRQPMRAALALVAHMVCLAAIYACLDVLVLALFQVLIYVGAVMVFMVYTIMLLDDRDASFQEPFSKLRVPAVVAAVAVAAALLWMLGGALPSEAPAAASAGGPAPFTFTAFSIAFLKQYWFHFELVTVLLLVGVVAAWTAIRESQA
jgi:NADH-quinone oxidoreductase subunit J